MTDLHLDTLTLHAQTAIRSHSDLVRTFSKALEELVAGGVLHRQGGVWFCGPAIVAQAYTYLDSVHRTQKALRFGDWLCLAMVLKFTQPAVRQILMDHLKTHPRRE